jgi:hypothetical protein
MFHQTLDATTAAVVVLVFDVTMLLILHANYIVRAALMKLCWRSRSVSSDCINQLECYYGGENGSGSNPKRNSLFDCFSRAAVFRNLHNSTAVKSPVETCCVGGVSERNSHCICLQVLYPYSAQSAESRLADRQRWQKQ